MPPRSSSASTSSPSSPSTRRKQQHSQHHKQRQTGKHVLLNKRGLSLVFDPEARREYLTGFSKRKTERRKFGLAMQKVKDRKARLLEREEIRKAKQDAWDELPASVKEADEMAFGRKGGGGERGEEVVEEVVYDDQYTTSTFGESVMVTTFLGIPSTGEEGEEEEGGGEVLAMVRGERKGDGVDREQLHAGSVARFKKILTGNMPAKTKRKGGREGTRENISGSYMPKGKGKGEDEGGGGGKRGKKGKKGKKGRR
ncbi:hypothetical protein VYU27_008231 [Nannochloropsis oceanica]